MPMPLAAMHHLLQGFTMDAVVIVVETIVDMIMVLLEQPGLSDCQLASTSDDTREDGQSNALDPVLQGN